MGSTEAGRIRGWTRRAGFYAAARLLEGSILVMAACGLGGCSSFNAFAPADDVPLGAQAYEEILAEERLIQSGSQVQMVRRVTDDLIVAAREEVPDLVDLFEWHVELIDNDEVVNAFCLPGGKMGVYTGILPVTQSDAGLAVVMGHEIAHATLRHGTQAVTRQMGVQGALLLISLFLKGDRASDQYIALSAQLAATLATLSYGRDAELAADRTGLRFMARAGYDPREAVAFWTRMAALGGGGGPEWLSTHPSNERRIEQLEEFLPEALELYGASR